MLVTSQKTRTNGRTYIRTRGRVEAASSPYIEIENKKIVNIRSERADKEEQNSQIYRHNYNP